MRLIGHMCKRREAFSKVVLIGRGLDQARSEVQIAESKFSLFDFEGACEA